MATGAYLPIKSEREYYKQERAREQWEVAHFPDSERAELLEPYQARGYSKEEVEMLLVGGLAAPVAYVVGVLLRGLGVKG